MLHYTITPHPNSHQWHISLRFCRQQAQAATLQLADWTPGSYMIRDFSRHIMGIQAFCDGEAVALRQTGKSRWQTPPRSGEYRIDYIVYANDMSVRASYLDGERGFFDGACLYLSVAELQEQAHEVCFSGLPGNWQLATALPCTDAAKHCYRADNYAALIDHPFELGSTLKFLDFTARGIPHRIALSGHYPDFDRARLIADAQKICEYELSLFPDAAPFGQFLFLLHLGDNIYGGLEHISSTALHFDRNGLPQAGMGAPNDNYIQLLGLISHEYFHCWNVKSIKPAAFLPYQLDRENYTEQLWAFEGITSYYDDLILVRSGVISPETYLGMLAKLLSNVYSTPGRHRQTLAQSSFAAWHKFYKQDENSRNAIISYYQHGAVMALCLDLLIRANSEHSLDTVMQQLYRDWLAHGKGIDEGAWQTRAQEIVGVDLADFFQAALYSTAELPVAQCLASVGIELRWLAEREGSSGALVDAFPEQPAQAELGCRFKQHESHAQLSYVANGDACEQAGLMPQDKIIAVDGFACTDFLRQCGAIGQSRRIHYFRHGVLYETLLTVQPAKAETAYLRIRDPQAVAAWLLPA